MLSTELRRDLWTGAAAGLVGGVVLAATLDLRGKMSMTAGLTGLAPRAALAVQLGIAGALGVGVGAIFRYKPESAAMSLTAGLLYGLLHGSIRRL